MLRTALRDYLLVTGAYWGFTITDGALRMLVVLYFHQLGYSPFAIASLFLFYEFFGVVTNLVGGWLGSRFGLNSTLYSGMALQIVALAMLTVDTAWLTVPYVMCAQALSGIAKDLNKMSAKSSVRVMAGSEDEGRLFRLVALLTGSKNSLKGAGFFIGAVLLSVSGFRGALLVLAGGLLCILLMTVVLLSQRLGKAAGKPALLHTFSKSRRINWLSAARFFLFGARDIWFVIGLPVYLTAVLQWEFTAVGSFMALWVIGYGIVQAATPRLLSGRHPGAGSALFWSVVLLAVTVLMPLLLDNLQPAAAVLVGGLALFGVVFAINSAVHSYLILAFSDHDKVAMDVGFYYMANAAGRLAGTLISGWSYQVWGMHGCLWWSAAFILFAVVLTARLAAEHKRAGP
jgi:predicted MFS family arabinose efflux permease